MGGHALKLGPYGSHHNGLLVNHPSAGHEGAPGAPDAWEDSGSHRDLLTDAGLLALAGIWGVNFSFIKVALDTLTPFAFNALRFPLASLVLLGLLRARGPLGRPCRADLPRIVGLGLLGHVLYQVFFIVGVSLTSAGNSSLLLATTPVWTILLSVALGHERPPPQVWGGVFGTLAGIVLVVMGGEGLGEGALVGDALMLLAAVGWSTYTVGSRTLVRRYGALPMTAWTLWVGTPGVFLVGVPALARSRLGEVPPIGWAGVVYAGAFGIAVAYVLWYHGVRRLGNARTAVYSNLVPVVALAVAWAWLHERPTVLQLIGAAVIIGGLSLARFGPRRGRDPGARVVPEST